MTETATYDPFHPLSRPKAAFTNHTARSSPANSQPQVQAQPEGSKDAKLREEASLADQQSHQSQTQTQSQSYPSSFSWPEDGQDHIEAVKLNHASPRINPFHLLSHPQTPSALPLLPPHLQALTTDTGDQPNGDDDYILAPVHITKVTPTTVEVTSQTPEGTHRKLFNKVSNVFRKEPVLTDPITSSGSAAGAGRSPVMQGAPPSPPLSEAGDDGEGSVFLSETHETHEEVVHVLTPVAEVTRAPYESPSIAHTFTTEPGDLGGSPSSLAPPAPFPRRVSSSSATSSRAGSLTIVRSGRLAPQRDQEGVGLGLAKSKDLPDIPVLVNQDRRGSAGSLLSANPNPSGNPAQPRMTRRSTNPTSGNPASPRSPLTHSQSNSSPQPQSTTAIPGLEGAALASDILAQTEILRQQRLERRQKKASAASEAQNQNQVPAVGAVGEPEVKPRVEERPRRGETQEDATRVLVGNLIGEDHVNYVLMYNMLTGIRIGVSRCQAKIKRPLTEDDYLARHKFSFDIVGNELTPSARYDFKFKDYAPWIFRDLRDEHFHLDPADYLLSLTSKYILSELGSPGKSGSFFYFSRDYRFIIKTISHAEHKFLRSILKDYHEHVKSNPHTLVSRFYGLHRVKLPRGRKIHFVIMNNLFPPHRDIHETYDLKGSAFGREYPEEKAAKNPRAVLKDKNWVNRARTLELGPEKRALLTEQLRRDMEFLKRVKVMDYSLLVGIHNMERGNRDNLRENQLTMFHPEVPPARRKPSTIKGPSEASNVRKAVRRSDPKMLDVASQLPNSDSADRRHFLFYQDEGGLRATDEANQNMDVIYYLGVIDICTPYSSLKKVEHFWKSMTEDRHTISCIDPITYGQRFINFLQSVMRGGDKSLRPIGLEEPTTSDQNQNLENETGERPAEQVADGPTSPAAGVLHGRVSGEKQPAGHPLFASASEVPRLTEGEEDMSHLRQRSNTDHSQLRAQAQHEHQIGDQIQNNHQPPETVVVKDGAMVDGQVDQEKAVDHDHHQQSQEVQKELPRQPNGDGAITLGRIVGN